MSIHKNSVILHAVVLLVVLAIVIIISDRIIPADHPNMDLNKYRDMASTVPGIVEDILH